LKDNVETQAIGRISMDALVIPDKQETVAGSDAEQRQEPNGGPKRDGATIGQDGEDTAGQGGRHHQQDDRGQAPAGQSGLQQQEYPDGDRNADSNESPVISLALGVPPSSSAWYSKGNFRPWIRVLTSFATAPTPRPLTSAVTSTNLGTSWCCMTLGVGATLT
jgi:hypothetical protein